MHQKVDVRLGLENGTIEGLYKEDQDIHVYKGIPYAAPPVESLRWLAPQPVQDWEGVLDCKAFGPIAMQADPVPFYMWTSEFIAPAGNMSEDCLYLNVWTPAKTTDEELPVIVYIHGGGFSSGSGSVPLYDGSNMAQKGVVFVTINYRVGLFGFFAHPELRQQASHQSSGNQGLLDQIAALEWVQNNITAFGGNPKNVTIAGQSAGAFSVSFLCASPLASGLFHKAIAESGGALTPGGRLSGDIRREQAEMSGINLQRKAGAASFADLQKMDAQTLLQIPFSAQPLVDGYSLKQGVYASYLAGAQNDVPLLTGWNADEGLGAPNATAESFQQMARSQYGEQAEKFLQAFPAATDEEATQSQQKLNALGMFGLASYQWMQVQNQHGKSPVYVYQFTRKVPYGEGQMDFGAFHSSEIGYAYDNLDQSKVRPWTAADRQLAKTMSAYWVNFARNGNPNGEGLPDWPACQKASDRVMQFDSTLQTIPFPDIAQLQILQQVQASR